MSYLDLEPPATVCFDPRIEPEGRSRVRPPPGWVANVDDPVSHTTQLLVLNVVCLSITSVFVAGRLYTKCYLTRKLQSDDGTSPSPATLCCAPAPSPSEEARLSLELC